MISSYIKSNGIKKSKKSEEIIGCRFTDLKIHLELKFRDGMTWENYGFFSDERFVAAYLWYGSGTYPTTGGSGTGTHSSVPQHSVFFHSSY